MIHEPFAVINADDYYGKEALGRTVRRFVRISTGILVEKDIAKLEEQKAAIEAAETEAAKKEELERRISELMAEGVSAAEILEKLK